jgi:hypothetical protein
MASRIWHLNRHCPRGHFQRLCIAKNDDCLCGRPTAGRLVAALGPGPRLHNSSRTARPPGRDELCVPQTLNPARCERGRCRDEVCGSPRSRARLGRERWPPRRARRAKALTGPPAATGRELLHVTSAEPRIAQTGIGERRAFARSLRLETDRRRARALLATQLRNQSRRSRTSGETPLASGGNCPTCGDTMGVMSSRRGPRPEVN